MSERCLWWRASATGISVGNRLVVLAMLASVGMLGCTTHRESFPKRTATEMAMIGYAAADSIDVIGMEVLAGRTVWINPDYLKTYDQPFVLGQIRAKLMESGAILAEAENEAEVIVEPRSAVLSVNAKDMLVGIPGIPVPVPGVGTVNTPELALLKHVDEQGLAGIGILAYERESREIVISIQPTTGQTRISDWSVLGIPVSRERRNLPEELNR